MSLKTFFKDKQNLKDLLWVFTGFTAVFGAVIFPGLSDYANHAFWWKFWDIAAMVCAGTVVAGWAYFWFVDPKSNE